MKNTYNEFASKSCNTEFNKRCTWLNIIVRVAKIILQLNKLNYEYKYRWKPISKKIKYYIQSYNLIIFI